MFLASQLWRTESLRRHVFRKGGTSSTYVSRQARLCVGGWGCQKLDQGRLLGREVPTAKLGGDRVRGESEKWALQTGRLGEVTQRGPRKCRGRAMILTLRGIGQKKTNIQGQLLPHKPQ